MPDQPLRKVQLVGMDDVHQNLWYRLPDARPWHWRRHVPGIFRVARVQHVRLPSGLHARCLGRLVAVLANLQ